ncbi:hypothetical protein [Nocardiopsis kunsanensis]|nr:hypothetical protein [Nocardiopsis kunsanensis]
MGEWSTPARTAEHTTHDAPPPAEHPGTALTCTGPTGAVPWPTT